MKSLAIAICGGLLALTQPGEAAASGRAATGITNRRTATTAEVRASHAGTGAWPSAVVGTPSEASWGPVKRPEYARAEIRDPDGNGIELRQWLGA